MTDTIYINTKKPRKTMSTIGYEEDTIYPAHTLKAIGLTAYVPKYKYDKLVELVEKTGNKELIEFVQGK